VGHHRTLWNLTGGQRFRYAAAILAMAASNAFLFAVPLVSRAAIDVLVGGEGAASRTARVLVAAAGGRDDVVRLLTVAAAAAVLLTAVGGALLYLRGRWAALASEAIVRGIRDRVYAHLEKLPCSFHDRADTGDLVQRATSDVETIRVFLSAQVVEIGRTVLLLLTVLPILVSLDGRMTLISVALFPLILAFAIAFFRRIQRLFLLTDEAEGRMTAVLQENLTGIRVVRAFARQDFEKE
jgi:ATP-binding cassette subfamily B protein